MKAEDLTIQQSQQAMCVLNVAVNHYNAGYARFPGSELDVALMAEGHIAPDNPPHIVRMKRDFAILYYRAVLTDDVFTYRRSDDSYGLSENLLIAISYIQSRMGDIHAQIANVMHAIAGAQAKYPDITYDAKIVVAVARMQIAGEEAQQAANMLLDRIAEMENEETQND
jgi:hypothetical protein